jgi:hypothetical protein
MLELLDEMLLEVQRGDELADFLVGCVQIGGEFRLCSHRIDCTEWRGQRDNAFSRNYASCSALWAGEAVGKT